MTKRTKKAKKQYVDDNPCSAIDVYACQSDLSHPLTLKLATIGGLLSRERYEVLQRNEDTLTTSEISGILERLFGFCRGNYESVLIEGQQTSRYGVKVVNEYRYNGVERIDKEWVTGGMASSTVKEIYKFCEEVIL